MKTHIGDEIILVVDQDRVTLIVNDVIAKMTKGEWSRLISKPITTGEYLLLKKMIT